MSAATDITLVTGECHRVEGDAREVERIIIGAARGSIMELAWVVAVGTGQRLAINPESVVMLRAVEPQ